MLDYAQPPRWVKARAECDLELKFEALKQVVERDVEDFNGLLEEKRQSREFRVSCMDEGTMPILRVEQQLKRSGVGSVPSVCFCLSPAAIKVSGGGIQFYVKPRWCATSAKCRLYVDEGEGPYEVWEISQKALGNLFFG